MNKIKIIKLITIVAGGIVVIAGIGMGVTEYWPIAFVDRSPIMYGAFKENFLMADHFYRSNVKIAGEDDGVVSAKDVQVDLQRATMEGLIEQRVIDQELEQAYSAEDLARLINNKLDGIDLATEDMRKATELLYGLTPEQFRRLVLIPKAKQELLEGKIVLQDGTFNDWLSAKKAAIDVSVFVPTLTWKEGQVISR